MRNVKRAAGVLLAVVFGFFYAHIAKPAAVYEEGLDGSEYLEAGALGERIEQEFVCEEASMDALSVKCRLDGDTGHAAVRLTLIEKETGKTAGKSVVLAKDIKSGRFCTFPFEKIEDAGGKTYKAVFENLRREGGAVFFYEPKAGKGAGLTAGGRAIEGTLVMKYITKRFDFETFAVFLFFVGYMAAFIGFLYRLFR